MNQVLSIAFAVLCLLSTHALSGYLDENSEIRFSDSAASELKKKSDELQSAVKIYEYVRNNTEYQLYHGSRSGSINSFLGKRGNDVDLASTLIAMLRSQGIPSEYAVGIVEVGSDDVMNWLGVKNIDLAVSIMDDQGIQSVVKSADGSTVQFEHAWVRALVAMDDYRGAGNASTVDCSVVPDQCQWIELDPSFKLREYHNQDIDVYSAISFDYDAYYNAEKNNDSDRINKNPLEIYEEQILDYLRQNHPGKTLEDVADPGIVIREEHGILPLSLPYKVVTIPEYFDSVVSHDTAGGKFWDKKAAITLKFGSINLPMGTYSLVDLATKRLTLTYELGSPERLVARLDGEETAVPLTMGSLTIDGVTVGLGYKFSMTVVMDGAPATHSGETDNTIPVTYNNLVVGGYYLIGTGGDSSNWSQVHRAANQLLAANEQYPIVNDAGGIPYVDENSDNVINAGEVRLLDHRDAMDALTGGLLYSAMTQYFARFRENIQRFDHLNHVISPIEGFVGVVSSVYDVEYIDGTAFSVMPGGLLIDMKGQKFTGAWRTDMPEELANAHFELVGHSMSSLEHEIWQEITGYDAVSTVRGIQMALANNAAELLNPKKNSTQDTLAVSYEGFGFANQALSPWVKNVRDVFTTRPVTWSNSQDDQYMDIMKSSVDLSTPSFRLYGWPYFYWTATSGPEGWVACVDALEDQLNTFIAQGYGNSTFTTPYQLCDGTTLDANATVNEALTELETHYFNTVIPNYIDIYYDQSYMEYFDRNQGFVPAEHIYRDTYLPADYHDVDFVQWIRNATSLMTTDFWREFVVPSRKTSGFFFRFSVYLDKIYENGTNNLASQSFIITNESMSAGGGYVDADEVIEQSADTTGVTFNNEIFTDQNLNALANNDLIRTPSTVDPVSTVTGNMYHDETDIIIKGRGIDYAFTRTYNSAPAMPDTVGLPLGFGWTHSYNMKLVANDYGEHPNYDATQAPENANGTTSSITYVDERGGESNYLVDDLGATWAVTPPQGQFNTLELDIPTVGQHTLTFRNGVKYIFDAQGVDIRVPGTQARLLAINDPYGNQLDFTYNASGQLTGISDNLGISGRTGLTLAYNAGNQLTSISDWTGRIWTYGYDADGNLISMSGPDNLVSTNYTYHPESHLLKDVSKPENRDGQTVTTTFSYYRNNKAFNYVNALGNTETLDYDLYRKKTRVTDPLGGVRIHSYDANGALVKLTEPDGAILSFNNTEEGLRYSKTDGLGYQTLYSYHSDRSISSQPTNTGGQVTLEQDPMGYTVEYDYGIHDQPTRVQDKNGNERIITYYAVTDIPTGAIAGKIQRVQATLNASLVTLEEYTWTPEGNLKQKTEYIDPADASRKRITTYAYDANGLNPVSVTTSGATTGGSVTVTYSYDDLGRKLSESTTRRTSATDPTLITQTNAYEYDSLGRVIKTTDPLGNIAETDYDQNGKVTQTRIRYRISADPLTYDTRNIVTHSYNAADQRISTTDVDGNTTTFEYDEAGNLVKTTDANNHSTRYEYDAMNRRTAVIDANGHRTETSYDLAGNVVKMTDANGNTTRYEYDALGRRTKTITPMGFETQIQYDGNGNVTHVTDANAVAGTQPKNSQNASVYNTYDELGRLIATLSAEEGTTTIGYDLLGNITSITDAEGRTTSFVYDDLGRLIETIDPLIEGPQDKTVTLTYDEAGNILTRTDRMGQVTRNTYDNANRLILTEYLADGTQETRTYDSYGNLQTLANADVTYTYGYDNRNRMTSKTDTRGAVSKTLSFTYDAVGNVTSKTDYQGEVTKYQYDSTNRLVSLTNRGYLQVSYHYDGAGRLLDRILSNGVKTSYTYDNNNRPLTLVNSTASGSVIHSESFEYDNIGNITKVTDQAGNITSYVYDSQYRLTSVDAAGTANDQVYTYDKVGNRLTKTENGQTLYYQTDAGNRLTDIRSTSPTGPIQIQYVYDDNGSRIEKLDGSGVTLQSYVYDQQRQITQITQGAQSNTFAYDVNNYRIRKTDTQGDNRYLLQAEHLEATYDENDQIRTKYLRGVVVDEIVNGYEYPTAGDEKTKVNLSFHHNHNKSVTGLSAHEGSTLENIEYDAFGNVIATTGSSNNRLRYTGREQDGDTGLYYYRARYYDPEAGRFLTEDPLGFEAGINFYAYVGNNPVNATDPTGLDAFTLGGSGKILGTGISVNAFVAGVPFFPEVSSENFDIGLEVGFTPGLAGDILTYLFDSDGSKPSFSDGLMKSGVTIDAGKTLTARDSNFDATYEINAGALGYGGTIILDPLSTESGVTGYEINVGPQLGLGGTLSFNASLSVGDLFTAAYTASDYVTDSISSPFSAGASGGYVLYPGRQNTNMMSQVYSK